MKKVFLFLFFMACFILSFQLASADCVNITIPKTVYFPGETFQAEISGNFSQDLAYSNIYFFKDGVERPLFFNLTTISKGKYFVYAELPSSQADIGSWSFEIQNALCTENKILKSITSQANFSIIKSLSDSYSWLTNQTKTQWPSSTDENSLVLLALADDANSASKGRDALLAKSTNSECWSSFQGQNCSVKSTALALMALKSQTSDAAKNKIINWLVDSQNNLNIGVWDIIFNSSQNTSCVLSINSNFDNILVAAGQHVESITSKIPSSDTINVSLVCPAVSGIETAKIVHTFFGKVTEITMQKEISDETLTFKSSPNNKKCWGNGFREDCNAISTSFAILALNNVSSQADLNGAILWLKNNSRTTEEKAFAYLFSKDLSIKQWLVNNQAQLGFWSNDSIAVNNQSDAESTIIALYSLINSGEKTQDVSDAISKAKLWIQEQQKNNFNNALSKEALLLSFIYPISQVEPIISVDLGIIKTVSNRVFSLTLRNKGFLAINSTISINELGIKQNLSVNSGEYKSATILIPARADHLVTTLTIDYSTKYGLARKYDVPMIIFASGSSEQTIPGQGIPLLPSSLSFNETSISEKFTTDKNNLLEIHLRNNAKSTLNNISITTTIGLAGIISVLNSSIPSISSGETAKIVLNITSNNAIPTNYSGEIQAEVGGASVSLPVLIQITSTNLTQNKTCSQLNGTVCKQDELCSHTVMASDIANCCMGKCNKLSSKVNTGRIIGFVMIFIAILVVILFLLRKPKKAKGKTEMGEVVEKIEEKYKK